MVSQVGRTRDKLMLSHSLNKLWNTILIAIRNADEHDAFRVLLHEHLPKISKC